MIQNEMLIAAIISFFMGCLVAYIVTESSWQNDCSKLGAHRSESSVFECHPRVTK